MISERDEINDFRYERKFLIHELSVEEVESIVKLHPAIFSEIYRSRFVNSMYFDSHNMQTYRDNIDGVMDRMKVRIRWYGDLYGLIEKPKMEFKIKRSLLGTKKSYLLNAFTFGADSGNRTIFGAINKSDIPDYLKFKLASMEPVLVICYRRKYFISADKNFRITIDSDLQFHHTHLSDSFFRYNEDHHVVLEIKYNYENDSSIEHITNVFPFRLTRCSKYIEGLTRLSLW